ncbi:hypothetical protein [Pseudomonas sp. 58(2021)]|uniref:hypothetical protein n=1 Tax=Pseudomonas sp. 58(2021) TaxID=2813330 RepID=UPI001A9F2DAF|nr:hypothetical protein [Pseudomonas sp. 58(2021)]
MKRFKKIFERLKEKHWDLKPYLDEGPMYAILGFDRPPLRAFWEKHKASIMKLLPWLAGLICGAVILKFLGLA